MLRNCLVCVCVLLERKGFLSVPPLQFYRPVLYHVSSPGHKERLEGIWQREAEFVMAELADTVMIHLPRLCTRQPKQIRVQ